MAIIRSCTVLLWLLLATSVHAQAAAAHTCKICTDAHQITCIACAGQGFNEVPCLECDDKGRKPCPNCATGKKSAKPGKVPCPNPMCRKGKMTWRGGKKHKCKVCAGRAVLKCLHCKLGKVPCACGKDSIRRSLCRTCGGGGKIGCPGCSLQPGLTDCCPEKPKPRRGRAPDRHEQPCQACANPKLRRGLAPVHNLCRNQASRVQDVLFNRARPPARSAAVAARSATPCPATDSAAARTDGGVRGCTSCKKKGYTKCTTCAAQRGSAACSSCADKATCGLCKGGVYRCGLCADDGEALAGLLAAKGNKARAIAFYEGARDAIDKRLPELRKMANRKVPGAPKPGGSKPGGGHSRDDHRGRSVSNDGVRTAAHRGAPEN